MIMLFKTEHVLSAGFGGGGSSEYSFGVLLSLLKTETFVNVIFVCFVYYPL